ncbi:hypothetical protein LXL04_029017 [Taraxacum kok-saghyz]
MPFRDPCVCGFHLQRMILAFCQRLGLAAHFYRWRSLPLQPSIPPFSPAVNCLCGVVADIFANIPSSLRPLFFTCHNLKGEKVLCKWILSLAIYNIALADPTIIVNIKRTGHPTYIQYTFNVWNLAVE